MLLELRVENYAVIDQVTVEFGPGLNLLTGETGAGKSILIDALALLLGEKASVDAVRHGAEKAVVAGVFEAGPRATAVLDENGIDASETGQIILRREIAAAGKGRVFINNQPATVTVLRQLAPALASIHAQNESILAFDAAARMQILDTYAGASLASVAQTFAAVKDFRQKIADLERNEQDRLRLVDLWSFQSKEIRDARLQPGEDLKLETEKRVLANAEKLYSGAMSAYEHLYDGSANAASLLRAAEKNLEELARFDDRFSSSAAALASARATAEDVGATVRDYAGSINASPERLAEIEDRLALLDRLKRKYGQTLEEVTRFGEEAAQKLNEIENRDQMLGELRRDLAKSSEEYLQHARTLSRVRSTAAKKLEKLVEVEINALAMKAQFKIEVRSAEDPTQWSAAGIDSVAYLIATNPGEPLKPVELIASGGELSRVLLALKATVEEAKRTPGNGKDSPAKLKPQSVPQRAMVFDEIDAGIGGSAAEAVGRKLKSLARGNQVLCVTHLPQIASFADRHFLIEKSESGGRTRTSIVALSAKERTEELARMLSGARLTDTSRRHAEQLLKSNA